jgi:hypothetical protein
MRDTISTVNSAAVTMKALTTANYTATELTILQLRVTDLQKAYKALMRNLSPPAVATVAKEHTEDKKKTPSKIKNVSSSSDDSDSDSDRKKKKTAKKK